MFVKCPGFPPAADGSPPRESDDLRCRGTSGFPQVVGAIGFEPTTYGSQNRRATRLRYAPTDVV